MTPGRKVFALSAALAVVTVVLSVPVAARRPVIDVGAQGWQFAIAFFVAEWAVAHIEIRRQAHTLSLSEAVLFLALMMLDPLTVVAARVAGASGAMALRRLRLQKFSFNVVLFAWEAALAAFLLHGAVRPHADSALTWAAAGAAVIVAVVLGAGVVAAVISLHDQTRPAGLLATVIKVQGLTALGSTSLAVVGTAAIAQAWTNAAYLGMLLLGAFVLLREQAATTQRASNLESIGRYTTNLVGLSRTDDVLTTSLREAAQTMRALHAALVAGSDTAVASRTYHLTTDAIDPVVPGAIVALRADVSAPTMLRDLAANGIGDLPDGFAAPIVVAGQPAIFVAWDRSTGVGEFTSDDLALFGSLVAQTQVALDRASLLDRLEHDAHHDALTGLPNRLGFADRVAVSRQSRGALFIMDLDRFKDINDTLGHPTGDQALTTIADRLRRTVGPPAILARLGGDEFAIFDTSCVSADTASALAANLVAAMDEQMTVEDLSLHVGMSIGIALVPDHGHDLTTLMRCADRAMYEAKRRQTGWHFYSNNDDNSDPRQLELIASLRQTIDARELEVWYQPKVRLDDGTVAGAEALARWHHPRYGPVSPGQFIPLAEGAGMMRALTDAILERVITDVEHWDQGQRLQVAVNLSMRNLLDDALLERIDDMVRASGIERRMLSFEITETAMMLDREHVTALLAELHAMGFSIAVDDYGTGYSSLAYLRELPIDALKIDRAFVANVDLDQANEVIVRSTIDLGHNLGLAVTAEGIERPAELTMLASLGCDFAQGYLISRPLPADTFAAWLATHQPFFPRNEAVADLR